MIYYVSGIPYSDELWHSGVLGQKWGLRRYQNPDGTLTALGRVHYGYKSATNAVGNAAKATGKAVGRAAKTVGEHELNKFKDRHSWMLSDAELAQRTDRLRRENTLRDERRKLKTPVSRKTRVAQDIAESAAKSVATAVVNKAINSTINKDRSASAKFVREFSKDWRDKSDSELEKIANKAELLRAIEGKGGKNKKDKAKNEKKSEYKDMGQAYKEKQDNGPGTWGSHQKEKAESAKKAGEDFASKTFEFKPFYDSSASTNAKAKKAEKWVRNSNVLYPDFVVDKYGNIIPLVDD